MTDNIKIEYINQHHRFFQDVIKLGKKHSSTLGFMPEGGFVDHAQKKYIIIAHNNSELIGYLMFRVVVRLSRINIVHLCVEESYRKQNIPTKLLDSLREKYQAIVSGISLNCRTDYTNAKALWEKYGFVSRSKKRSRSLDENYLYNWWYDFNNPDLFNMIQETTPKIKALLDTNIIVKLRDNQIDRISQDPRPLLADWLVDEVDYFYAPELLNEITRDKNRDREEKTRRFLESFEAIRLNVEECKNIANHLKSIISGNTDNDKSDRMQLATAIASKTSYFITFDIGILAKGEVLEEQYDIQIFTPQEFIIEIDQLLNKEEYSPSKLKGVTFHTIERVSNNELDNYIDLFLVNSQSEKKADFKNIVYPEAAQIKSSKIKVVKQEDTAIAFFSYKYKDSTLIISFIRLSDTNQKRTLFMQLVSDFINKAINKNLFHIKIEEKYLFEYQKSILERLGFDNHLSVWVKVLCAKVMDTSQLSELPTENSISEILKEKNADEIKSILLNFEHKYFPLKFSDLDIPCYIIPIKPYWAGQLFDMNISGSTLFGANPDKLWNIENIYYRHTQPITEIAPARILWYASTDKNFPRSQSIIATSYLDEVMTGKPKLLFQRNKHYGIYEWKNIYDLCKKDIEKDIRVLRFSKTEVFNKPIRLSVIRQIFIANGKKENTFASPVKVSNGIFTQIYLVGNGKN
jgi:predicted nucleic acid-binding protein/ribosomal protein S18 acetylase RimI-like enzyme